MARNRSSRPVFALLASLVVSACASTPAPVRPRMGPPPPGDPLIVGEPVPRWSPEQLAAPAGALHWEPLGPRPIVDEYWSGTDDASGRVVSLAPHPSDPDLVYAASASGGLWKTVDGGTSWAPLTDELSVLNHGCVALVPGDPDRLYLGTGEYTTLSTGDGLFTSPDGGTSWSRIGEVAEVGSTCSRVLPDPSDPDGIHLSGNAGYVRSLDGGASWSTRLSGAASDLAIASSTVFVGLHNQGLYRSTDGGDTFSEVGTGTGAGGNGLPETGMNRILVAISPSDPSVVYTAFLVGSSLQGLYRSDDGGDSWTEKPNTPDFPNPQGSYDAFLGVDPADPDTIWCGGVFPSYAVAGVIRSTDGGDSWNDVTIGSIAGQVHPDMHTVAFGADGRVWVGSDGGVWSTADGGATWDDHNDTLTVTQNYQVALHPGDGAQLMGGTQDNGTVGRDLGTEDWPQLVSGDGGFLVYDFDDPSRRYTTYVYLQIFRLVGAGGFADITGPWNNDPRRFIAPLVMDPNDASTLVGGTNRVWRTRNADGTATWTPISTDAVAGQSRLTALAVAPGASDTIWAAGESGQIGFTSDAATWFDRSTPTSAFVSDIILSPTDQDTAVVGHLTTTGSRVFFTDDAGVSWTDLTGDLPAGVAARALAVDWRAAPPVLFLGSGAGVWWSEDFGQSWSKDGSDLPNVNIGDLRLDRAGSRLYAGSYGRGAWVAEVGWIFRDGFESGDDGAWSAVGP